MSQRWSQFDYELFEKVDLDLAVVKAMTRAPLTLDELKTLQEMDTSVLIVEHGLDYMQAEEVMNWAKHESQRLTAQHVSGLRNPGLSESRSRKISGRRLRRIITEEKAKLLKEESPASRQANLLSAIDQGIGKVEEVEKELYGLVDPGLGPHSQGMPLGDELGKQLAAAIVDLNSAFDAVELYFDDEAGRNPGGSIG
jgi:hypothetical protein